MASRTSPWDLRTASSPSLAQQQLHGLISASASGIVGNSSGVGKAQASPALAIAPTLAHTSNQLKFGSLPFVLHFYLLVLSKSRNNWLLLKEKQNMRTGNVDIDEYARSMNRQLSTFIELVTKSVHSRSGVTSNSEVSITKKVCRLFIACLLIFCTNPSCATPLHYLMADAIEVCGGSRQLMKLFNKLGAVVSSDTYDKFVVAQSNVHKEHSMWQYLNPDSLSIATVDNFDKQSQHAMVNCGATSRSYHGTSIMVVHPNLNVMSKSPDSLPCHHSTPASESEHSRSPQGPCHHSTLASESEHSCSPQGPCSTSDNSYLSFHPWTII